MKKHFAVALTLASLALASPVYAVEGKIEITGTTNITAPGSYILVNNINATSGFYISSDNVKLDLNGFTISSAGGFSTDGITIFNHKNVEISNGTITGFPRHGIFAPGSSTTPNNIKLRNLNVTNNTIFGISLENHPGFIIEDCAISGNGASGIYANGAGLIQNNIIGNNNNGMTSYSAGKAGYRQNVFFNNTASSVSGSAMNLGSNICNGVLCP